MSMSKRLTQSIGQSKGKEKSLIDRDKLISAVCSKQMAMILSFISGFLLTRVSLFGQYAPLGTAFSAASSKRYSFAAAAGAILGYITVAPPVDGIKYIAATLLCLAAVHIFRETDALDYRIFVPMTSGIAMSGVGFVFLLEQGLEMRNILLFALEIMVTMCAAWFYQDAQGIFKESADSNRVSSYGMLILVFSILCAFARFNIFGLFSPVRVVSVLIVMCASASMGNGAAVGLAAGLLTDAVCASIPFFCLVYAMAGLFGSLAAKRKNKAAFITMFIISGAAAAVWSGVASLALGYVLESTIAAVLFLFAPDRLTTRRINDVDNSLQYAAKIREYTAKRLSETGNALCEICRSLTEGGGMNKKQNDQSMRVVFDCAAEKVCRKCEIRHSCWDKEYVTTFTAFNDTTQAIIKNGRAEPTDYPSYFAERCLYFKEFCASVNQSAEELMRRRRYKVKLDENMRLMGEQYSGVAKIFTELAEDVFKSPEFRPFDEKRVNNIISEYDGSCRAAVYKARTGALVIEIEGARYQVFKEHESELCDRLTKALGRKFEQFAEETDQSSSKIIIRERERFGATIGVGVRKKHGKDRCGDTGKYFKTEEGMAYMLLSDGMGTGEQANVASETSVKLFEGLLKAGIEPEKAFHAAAPALQIKSEHNGFSTLDIFSVNLMDGRASLLKCGSAQSYIKISDKVSKIESNPLPLGVLPSRGINPDIADMRMKGGDLAVIISDGVADEEDDKWISDVISNYKGQTPKELAHEILANAAKYSSDDDMTVLVMKIDSVPAR